MRYLLAEELRAGSLAREKPVAPAKEAPPKPEQFMTLEEIHAELAELERVRVQLMPLLELPTPPPAPPRTDGSGNRQG